MLRIMFKKRKQLSDKQCHTLMNEAESLRRHIDSNIS